MAYGAPPAATVKPASGDPNRLICVTEDVTGSRLNSKRICHTASEWEAYRQTVRSSVDRAQSQNAAWVVPAGVR